MIKYIEVFEIIRKYISTRKDWLLTNINIYSNKVNQMAGSAMALPAIRGNYLKSYIVLCY
jgi:hypothetical protein